MSGELAVWLAGRLAGRLRRDSGRVSFSYGSEYRNAPRAMPLSWSLPLTQENHGPETTEPWFDNLLPDNDQARARWARGLGLARPTVFDILARAGEDCPGAIQVLEEGRTPAQASGREPLSLKEVGDRIRALREAGQYGWSPGPEGRWSLGGAQPKFAVGWSEDVGWYEPTGREPSTHIIKIGFTGKDESDWAEHLTSRVAAKLGLTVAQTEVVNLGGERAVVVRRFDRLREPSGRVRRLHQEDCCQALGLWRHVKYESDGGPGLAAVAQLLSAAVGPRHGEATLRQFAGSVVFSWLAACPDAHAKNYALLHLGPSPRLAPLFDLASASMLWNAAEVEYSARLAMSLDGENRLFALRARHLAAAARDLGVPEDWILAEARRQLNGLGPALDAALAEEDSIPDATAASFREGLAARVASVEREAGLP
ncbi:MAG: HipA domain-containing protein [Bifidobacteriaceae bacterium]|jgi:serine/threonine-protein kinase HipA|nr:HipA domain-containing protein [Bifidobacteriaceae bacterium]